jgi:small GTP-binding protein
MSCCSNPAEEIDQIQLAPPKLTGKVCLLGDSAVGKTSLLNKYVTNSKLLESCSTVGVAFIEKQMVYHALNGEQRSFQCQFWDTAGQERFNAIVPTSVRNSDLCIIAFSLVDLASFNNIKRWIETLYRTAPNCDIILVGCKLDLFTSAQYIDVPAFYPNYRYFQTSAMTGEGINEVFSHIAGVVGKVTIPVPKY